MVSKENGSEETGFGKVLEVATLAMIAVASTTVGVLDLLGFLDNTFLASRLGSMTLVVLGLVAGYLILERRGTLAGIRRSIDEASGRLAKLETSSAQTSSFISGLSGDKFSELRLLYGIRAYGLVFHSKDIVAGRDQIFNMWADMLKDAGSFLAFNHVSADEVWGTEGWAFNVAHALQLARLNLGCVIKRVFVVDDKAELERMLPLMNLQSKSGIDVRWLLKSELSTRPVIMRYLADLESWDFVVVDNDMVFKVSLNEKRAAQGCSVSRDRNLHEKALHVFREAYQIGYALNQSSSFNPNSNRQGA